MSRVLIIGKGVVGTNLGQEISALSPEYVDPPKGIYPKEMRHDYGFVCVDTPLKDGFLNTKTVEEAIAENDCEMYIIKSTVPVGFTSSLAEKTGKKIY